MKIPAGATHSDWPRVAHALRALGVEFDRWQIDAARIALARRGVNGPYAAGVGGVILSIPRQVGKTFWLSAIAFAICLVSPGSLVVWTAHQRTTAQQAFEDMQAFARRQKVAPFVSKIYIGDKDQSIVFKNGSRIMVGARGLGFGRGFKKVKLLIFDEAQKLPSKTLEDMVPSTNQAKDPLVFFAGTPPRPIDEGETFTARRREVLAGDDEDTFYLEFSADPDADSDDRKQWAVANPSYPTRTPVTAILRMKKLLADDVSFRREALGIWDSDAQGDGPLSKSWPLLAVDAPPSDGVRAFGVAFSADGMKVSLGGCIVDADRAHIELIDAQQGPVDGAMGQLADWFVADVGGVPRWRRASLIVLSGRAGALVLEQMLVKRKVPRRRIVVASTSQYFQACGMLLEQSTAAARQAKRGDALSLTVLSGNGQGQLAESAKKVVQEKRSRDGAWGWSSPAGDETPVEAVSLAFYGARNGKKPRASRESSGVIL